MLKTLVPLVAALIIGSFFIVGIASADHSSDIIIPLNQEVPLSYNVSAYLIQVSISDTTIGNGYSPDPEHSLWLVLAFKYKNTGSRPVIGRLTAQFIDNSSAVHEMADDNIVGTISPGGESKTLFLESSMPIGYRLTQLVIVDGLTGQKAASIPIIYSGNQPGVAGGSSGSLPLPDEGIRNLMLVPIMLGIIGLVGWYMSKHRLF